MLDANYNVISSVPLRFDANLLTFSDICHAIRNLTGEIKKISYNKRPIEANFIDNSLDLEGVNEILIGIQLKYNYFGFIRNLVTQLRITNGAVFKQLGWQHRQ